MSRISSAVQGDIFNGAVSVEKAGLHGMITVRCELDLSSLSKATRSVVGLAVPAVRCIKNGARGSVAWMSTDELMLFCAYEKAGAVVAKLEKALWGEHFLAVNVSDARSSFTLKGKGVREVLGKGSPADVSPEGLPVGEIRRTRLGQVGVAFWLTDEETLHLVCFRSVAAFVFQWLCVAAQKDTLPGHY